MKAKWECEITPAAQRELKRLPHDLRVKILSKVVALCEDPMNFSQTRKLKGSADRFRLRVGDYRVAYTVNERPVPSEWNSVRHRREAYRGF
ncbi:MAG: type II toxin-antitoxin system RelE/ParE family toxin [Bryobacterales bacterium]